MNSAAVNYYFRSKDALLERALAATTENAIGDWERIVENESLAPRERLRAVLEELLEGVRKFPNLSRAHLYGPIMEGDFGTAFARRFRSFVIRASEALAPALSREDAPELRLAALFSAAMGWGLLGEMFADFPRAAPGDPEARKRYLELLLNRFVDSR
jgi:AcrR family transcriptional regulator